MPNRLFLVSLLLCLTLLSGCSTTVMGTGARAPSSGGQASHAASSATLPPVRTAYAALGASETYGVGAQPRSRAYAYQVAQALHAHPFVNLGIPGATLPAAYDTELTRALSIRPRLCTAFFGFNDLRSGVTRSAFLQNLNDLIVTLRRAQCRVLVIGLPDVSILPAVRRTGVTGVHAIVTSWNKGMQSVAKRRGARFLSLAQYTSELGSHPEYISADGLHPSNAGYTRLAQVVLSAIHRYNMFRP